MSDKTFTGDDAVRPQETAGDRLRWAYGTRQVNPVAEVTVMDAIDYRGQTAGTVLQDCMEQMGLVTDPN